MKSQNTTIMSAEMREFLDHMGDMIFTLDLNGYFISVNRSGIELYGYTREEYSQLNYRDIVAPEYQSLATENLQRKLSGEIRSSALYELLTYTKTGNPIWVELATTLIDAGGEPVCIQGIARNITPRHYLEQQLYAGQERLQRIFNSMEDIYFYVDPQGTIIDTNPALLHILGYAHSMVIGTGITALYAHLEERTELLLQINESGSVFDYEVSLRHKDGHIVPFSLNAHLVKDEDGHVIGMEGIGRNITKRTKVMRELLEARDIAIAANASKTRFLSVMSHEVRTPLNGIVGLVNLLETTETNAEQRQYIALLNQVTVDLHHIVDGILDLAKIESGKMDVDLQTVNLHGLLIDLTAIMKHKIEEKGLVMSVQWDSNIPELVLIDGLKLKQIMLNFITNAIKFTQRGGIRITARCVEEQGNGRLRIRLGVEDTGIGIPLDRQAKIFDNFIQADASTASRYGGTGLGMAISKELAKLLGGSVGVRSLEGVGSLFWAELPIQADPSFTCMHSSSYHTS